MTARAFASVVVLGTWMGVGFAVGCADKDESTFETLPPDPPSTDAGDADPNGAFAEEPDADAGPTSCPPGDGAAFAPTWTAPAQADASGCGAGDISGYATACLADLSAKDTCAKWRSDHASCAACIEPTDGAGPIQWHLDRYYMTVNVGGCIALQQGDGSATSCGAAYNASVQCARARCEGCFTAGGTFEQFTACQKQVSADKSCDSYRTAQSEACVGYKDAGAASSACFPSGGEANQAYLERIIGLFCGGS